MTRPHMRDERGAVAIMIAVAATALLLASAMVLDFGVVRFDRQTLKSSTDAAVAAGLQAADKGTGDFYNSLAVCTAYQFLKANNRQLSSLPAGPVCASPSNTQVCTPGDPVNDVTYHESTPSAGGKSYEVWIKSRYSVSESTGGGFAQETLSTLSGDTGDPAKLGCDQLAVIVKESSTPGLGRLVRSSPIVTRIRSVGRVNDGPAESPYALLILERTACDALAITSGGAGARIDVTGFDTHPANIHVDSAGSGSQCGSKPIIEGKNAGTCPDPAPPAASTCGGVVAHEAPVGGTPGKITVVGASNISDGTPRTYAGPYPGTSPTHRDQVTRKVLDKVYLQGVKNAVDASKTIFSQAASGSVTGFTDVGCPSGTVTAVRAFVTCTNFNNTASFPNATDVVFAGKVASSGDLLLPKATRVYVAGGSPSGLSVGTKFFMNDNGTTCPTAFDPLATRAQLFIKNGSLNSGGGSWFRACNTTVMLLGGDSNGCLPPTSPYTVTYTDTPCPGPSTGNGTLDLSGNGTIDWTAPNLVDDLVKATDADHLALEDLALWDETYGTQNLGGTGYMHLSGVFAAPNATPFKINGGGTQEVKNSQYVVRQLWNTGNGTLSMRPLPSLPVAPPKFEYTMVR